jgi:hypothetical protein
MGYIQAEQLNLHVNRRKMVKRAGIVLGASGALAALAIPTGAISKESDGDDVGWAPQVPRYRTVLDI